MPKAVVSGSVCTVHVGELSVSSAWAGALWKSKSTREARAQTRTRRNEGTTKNTPSRRASDGCRIRLSNADVSDHHAWSDFNVAAAQPARAGGRAVTHARDLTVHIDGVATIAKCFADAAIGKATKRIETGADGVGIYAGRSVHHFVRVATAARAAKQECEDQEHGADGHRDIVRQRPARRIVEGLQSDL